MLQIVVAVLNRIIVAYKWRDNLKENPPFGEGQYTRMGSECDHKGFIVKIENSNVERCDRCGELITK